MIPIGGKPIISYVMESLQKNGISKALVIAGYGKEAIRSYLGDGGHFGLGIEYAVQPKRAGTADAIKLAEDYVANEPFLTVYGDQLIFPNSVEKVLNAHQTNSDGNIMALVTIDTPEYYGIVSVENSRVKKIVEKPSSKRLVKCLANAGVYIFQPNIFSAISQTKKSRRGEFEITDSLQFLIDNGSEVKAVQLDRESWVDIGRPWNILEANESVLKNCRHGIDGVVEEGVRVVPPVTISRNAIVKSGSTIVGPVFVGEDSELGPNCRIRPYTSIGKDVKIGPFCDVKNSVIMDGTKIPHLTYVGDSVIGERCNLGAGTNVANLRLDNATVKTPIRGKLVDSGRRKLGVILGDDVRVGINASLMPGVKVGSQSWIGPGVVLDRDVPSDTIVLLRQVVRSTKRRVKQRV
jgi:bifunctional UDP-N-acetylglucosamine pyrophosphorylase/glucosamine-1-phosphate N-acetyltransferase